MRLSTTVTLAACLLAALPAAAQKPEEPAKNAPDSIEKKVATEIAANWATAPVEEVAKSKNMKVSVGGRSIGYTATAGTLTIRDANGKPTASIFYTAYTAPSSNGKRRPVTFLYNGGPGSASLWLRMGSFAPIHVRTTDPTSVAPAPFDVGPNADTLIGSTDMVFIDAPGAGYSRPLGDTKPSTFYGVDQDVDAFAKAITRYIAKNKRWGDPKYIFGESYGTTRSGALAYKLEDEGVALNGVILLSSIMNYGIRQSGFDTIHIGYLPSYAATAWYHNRVADKPADLASFVEEARAFANGPYAAALLKGQDITPEEEDSIARQLSRFTGLSVDYLKRANLRVDLGRFRKELLRDQRATVGRFDSRYMGIDDDAAGEEPEYDASSTGITGLYVSSFQDYLTRELGYETELTYRGSARDGGDFKWDWSHRAPDGRTQNVADVTADLSAAMRINPHLRVLSLNGYYDMATPFFSTERDLKHMMLAPNLRQNLQFRYYPAGHMVYLNPDALHTMRVDLERFYAEGAR
ncbi:MULTISPECIES: S10 family peptidase [Sphingomonadales]|uniref:Peptidase S10 n=2 Tax=Edaphosphingomonas TaxID=3423724 RepID=A0A2T4HPI9_9SPHN|nr:MULTISPECIES: peptidase S10 [Sphingomonas]AGH49071.1 peptidase S10 family protein [Sphingomonas sp. MM-1]MDX3883699.1 peptidase S10 [Sphingomonas sp.]OHT21492.1 Serine carboxypeptidase [Sphingomonas haloaromaticamans]PTD17702.1 peptidase S10 [Sphingomonas fennica]